MVPAVVRYEHAVAGDALFGNAHCLVREYGYPGDAAFVAA